MMKAFFAVAALVAACTVAAAPADPVYNVKVDEPSTGSHITKSVLLGDAWLPLNRTWAELSDEDKRKVRSQYEAMPAGDEPPFPAEGLLPIYKAIGEGQRHLRRLGSGQMTLVATVDSQGKVAQVQVLGQGVPGLNEFVAQVLMVTPFKPAVCGGQPCRMDFPFRLRVAH